MIRGNKLMNFVERLDGWKHPVTADIFLTDYCNNKCQYCRYGHESGLYIRFADFQHYLKRLIELGVRGVILTGGGEPTINPDFDKIVHFIEQSNVPYGINTNLNKRINVGEASFIKVSIDTGDRLSYKELRNVDKFDTVVDNLLHLINDKKDNDKMTRIGIQCVTNTIQQVERFYNYFKYIDVDYIQFRPLEHCYSEGEEKHEYNDILLYLKSMRECDKRIVISPKYSIMERYDRCYANWSVITVDVNGNVPYCCHKPNEIVGNIFDDTILDKLKAHDTDMQRCETPCRLSMANKTVREYIKEADQYFI